MYNYVTDSVKLHNTLMVLMEISLILELWILFSRIMREEKLKKMVSIGVLFFSSFFFFLFSSTLPMSNQTSFLKFTDLQFLVRYIKFI